MAALAGLLVFLLFASGYLPQLQALNIWVLSGLPLLVWVLAFGARAYFFGGALDHYQFLHEQAEAVLRSWQQWAQRSLVVHARCVLLPDQVSARVLVQGKDNLPARQGQALRIAGLPTCVQARAHTGLRLLLAAMEAIFQKLQPGQTLHVTLLSDVPPDQYEALRSAWQHQWSAVMPHWPAVTLALSAELPYQWIESSYCKWRVARPIPMGSQSCCWARMVWYKRRTCPSRGVYHGQCRLRPTSWKANCRCFCRPRRIWAK